MPPKIRHDSESSCGVKGVRCVGGSDSSIEKENLSSFFFSILSQITLTQLTNFNFERDRQDKKILLEFAAKVFAPAPLAGGLAQDAPRVFLCYKNTYARESLERVVKYLRKS